MPHKEKSFDKKVYKAEYNRRPENKAKVRERYKEQRCAPESNEKYLAMRRAYSRTPTGLENQRLRKLRYKNSLQGRAKALVDSARKRAKEYSRDFDIDFSFIKEKLERGVCEATGIAFVLEADHPYAPSIDRVDSALGYTASNTKVVVHMYNMCKNNWTAEQTRKFLVDAKPQGFT